MSSCIESLRYACTLIRTLFATSLALLRNRGALRHCEREGIANPQAPESLTSHGEYEYLARIRLGLYPVGR